MTRTYTVRTQFPFTGFFEPVANLPHLNVAKAGGSIPVRFSLGGNRGLAIIAPGYPTSGAIACVGIPDELASTETPGASTLTYDPVTDRYQYVWKTQKAWAGTCRQFVLKLVDGSVHSANFSFK